MSVLKKKWSNLKVVYYAIFFNFPKTSEYYLYLICANHFMKLNITLLKQCTDKNIYAYNFVVPLDGWVASVFTCVYIGAFDSSYSAAAKTLNFQYFI